MSEAAATASGRPNPLEQVSDAVFRCVVYRLHKDVLPPDVTDPEEVALLIDAGIAAVASMLPANADEANIAIRALTGDAQASACIGYANQLTADPVAAMKCLAQVNHFHRTANAARALLLRVQTARRKREANKDTCGQDAWTEHCAADLMVAAAQNGPVSRPAHAAGSGRAITRPPEPPPPPSAPAEPEPPPPPLDLGNKFARYDIAEQYAALYPRRSAEIRHHGGVPPTATWGPPEPEIVEALLNSTSPVVLQADQEFAHLYA